MRLKTVFSGIFAGVGLYFTFMRLAYDSLPAQFIKGWRTPVWQGLLSDEWVSIIIFGFAALSLLLGGWLAAAWNKAKTLRDCLSLGASAGLIAGALGFNLVGGAWAGLIAQKEIYLHLGETLSEKAATELIVNAVSETTAQTQFMFWQFMIASVLLGILGGFFFALENKKEWKTAPALESGWLYRLPAYMLTLSGLVSFLLMFVLMYPLSESTINTLFENALTPSNIPSQFMLFITSLTAIPLFLLPFLVTIAWLIKGGKKNHWSWVLSLIWSSFLAALIYFFSNNVFRYIFDLLLLFDLKTFIGAGITAIIILGGIYLATKTPSDEKVSFSVADWIGFALTQGILSGTQFLSGSVTFSLSLVLVTVLNITTLFGTPSDQIPPLPVKQIQDLFAIQRSAALTVIGGMSIVALLIGFVILFLRGITSANRRTPKRKSEMEMWK